MSMGISTHCLGVRKDEKYAGLTMNENSLFLPLASNSTPAPATFFINKPSQELGKKALEAVCGEACLLSQHSGGQGRTIKSLGVYWVHKIWSNQSKYCCKTLKNKGKKEKKRSFATVIEDGSLSGYV